MIPLIFRVAQAIGPVLLLCFPPPGLGQHTGAVLKEFGFSAKEIAKLREANLIVAEVLDALEAASKPGVATWELNELAAAKLKQLKAEPAFLNYGHPPYPAVVCTSVNHVVVHGVPRRDVVLKEGDILSIDFGAFKDGWCGDSARTVPIGPVSPAAKALMDATRESLERAIAAHIDGIDRHLVAHLDTRDRDALEVALLKVLDAGC